LDCIIEETEKEEIENIKNHLTENYDIPDNFFFEIDNYSKNIKNSNIESREIKDIFFKIILAKTGLHNFYMKYGYENTDIKISISNYFKPEQILVDSQFGILNKKISKIKI